MLGMFGMAGGSCQQSSRVSVGGSGAAWAESAARSAQKQVKILEANLAKSLMICEALWEMLRDAQGLTEEDLHRKIYEIDMRDGVFDGKNQRKPIECQNCHHTVSPRHPACIYCGKVIDTSVFTME